jgi:hypothetical protein
MQSIVELAINLDRPSVAELFADPANNPKWMHEIDRVEPLSGKLGEPGSVYRLVPKKKGELEFVATVVLRELPSQVRLSLEAPTVSVSITDKFISLSDQVTLLVSEETFRFKGLSHKVFGFFAQPAIKAAHRRHMESFKRFAEIETDRLSALAEASSRG